MTNRLSILLSAAASLFAPAGARAQVAFHNPIDSNVSLAPQAVADVNQDGHLDLIGTSVTGLAVALGDGTGRFATELTVAAVGSEETIKMGDVNDDGRADEGEAVLRRVAIVQLIQGSRPLSNRVIERQQVATESGQARSSKPLAADQRFERGGGGLGGHALQS